MRGNTFINSEINKDQFKVLDALGMTIEISGNVYDKIYVNKQKSLYTLTAENSHISIKDETLKNSWLDDLFSIPSCKSIDIHDFTMQSVENTKNITDTSAVFRIDQVKGRTSI